MVTFSRRCPEEDGSVHNQFPVLSHSDLFLCSMPALLPAFLRSVGGDILQPLAACLGRNWHVEFLALGNTCMCPESSCWEEERHRSTGILPDSYLGNNLHKNMGNQNLQVYAFWDMPLLCIDAPNIWPYRIPLLLDGSNLSPSWGQSTHLTIQLLG
jgi:hypothetical protein